jgi:E3 ubiquitin-protein ligase UBR2
LNVLFEEFLQLLIILIGERYDTCIANVNKEAKLKREVIHQLCISPMAHSDIVKNIYPDTVIFTSCFLFTFDSIFRKLIITN